jgi:valyl-tRNA synthetase
MPADQGGETIMTAHWPTAFEDDFMAHYGLVDTVDQLVAAKHELVTAGRNLRAIGNIPFAKKVDYILKPAGALDPYEAEVIQSLLNAEGLEVNPDYAPRKGTPTSRSALGELFLPLDGLIDLEAEKARLEGQLQKFAKEIEKASAKLNNPKFTERAPEEVLQEARDRLAEWQEKERQTRESIEYLSEA